MKKLIFFDIDGTLILPGCPPRPIVVQAIQAVKANGHKVFLSTGRLEHEIPDSIRAIGFDGGIYSAGGQVIVDQKKILDQPLSADLLQKIIETLQDNNLFYILETGTGAYSGQNWRKSPYLTQERYASIKSRFYLRESEERQLGDPVYKVVFIAPLGVDLWSFIKKFEPSTKVVVFSNLTDSMLLLFGEITSSEIHKGRALLHICRHLDTNPMDCIAFGDSMNDAEILCAAGLGIAVGNADDKLKEIADEICGSFAEDGIANALEKLRLI